ncbi:MAG TPA: hypothetical protein VNO52_04825 [Methylomirabilota bacterium]|nr:hypothetical protein [Methylomirabilota bacterium]
MSAVPWLGFAQATVSALSSHASRADYMRVEETGSNTIRLEIAIREFRPSRGQGPVVWLSAVTHLGETNYYRQLQKHLDEQELVLYEGVEAETDAGGRPTRFSPSPPRSADADAEAPTAEPGPGLQATMAASLGLAFQLAAIDYSRPHFRHSDLSLDQIATLTRGTRATQGGDSGPGDNLQMLLEVMNGDSMAGALAAFATRLLGSSPKLRAFTRLMLIETIGRLDGDLTQAEGLPRDLRRLIEVLLAARNEAVVNDLKQWLARKEPPRSISLFYGAAHMPDLEKRLVRQLNYRLVGERWLAALTVDVRQAGLTPAEIQLARSTVQWQLDVLNGSRSGRRQP